MSDQLCDRITSRWNGEYEGNCILPIYHEDQYITDHWDGASWFDDDGECTDDDHLDYEIPRAFRPPRAIQINKALNVLSGDVLS